MNMNDNLSVPRYNLDTCATLCEVSIKLWTARKLDRTVSDEVVRNKSAGDKGAARVNKNLLAGRNELEVIQQHASLVRKDVYRKTLAWSDNGLRLLPSLFFKDFDDLMKEHERKYWTLVNDFVQVYPTLITAQAMALGDLFDRDEYPRPEALPSKFAFNVFYSPMPAAGDFRIDVGNEARKELQERAAQQIAQRVEAAMTEVRTNLREHLERMVNRLAVDVVDGKAVPRVFHSSLLEYGWELCDLIKGLNITQDRQLEQARYMLESTLTGVDVKTLREDMMVRHNVQAQVNDLLKNFDL